MNINLLNRRNHASKQLHLNYLTTSSLCISLLGWIPVKAQQPLAVPAPVIAQSEKSPATPTVFQQILGQWQSKDPSGQELLTFIFTPEGKLFIVWPTKEKPVPAVEMAYQIDTASQPMHLDIKVNTKATVFTVFEFTKDGKLRLQIEGTSPGQPRPTALNENATLFEKVSEATTLPADVLLIDIENQNRNR
ncbi:MAG: hypothetical protein N3E45_00695 [Oscillatoriaceae bacterium SKW80]|nr:hypothetical protein [Oscillatoriaceae bacterium SKYG93]MCX8119347.1 hypothetical protein [Oscillatoriaceae bacterium SKW80]MDW8454814.1 hypothetical protein [Oscillatoriaceae cyanobacterium SKYGB_i_bin93]HIK28405.1 hypothetical protein [Oscillatoriaceae cyanobacterium M7585_C2015_266]